MRTRISISTHQLKLDPITPKPLLMHLTHHDIEYMPNGNVLLLAWNRREVSDMVGAGRRPELLPDGQLWVESVIEIQPNAVGVEQSFDESLSIKTNGTSGNYITVIK